MISCIVPVYNNEGTISQVLNTLRSCSRISEIIVVDDCSQDGSAEVIRRFTDVAVIYNERNLGKGGAVVRGIRSAQGDILMICDADLSRLQSSHIDRLIHEYQTGKYDMVIAGRETDRGFGRLMARLSGERIFERQVIDPYLDLIAGCGNGIEQIINFAHQGKKVKIIVSKDIGHILKYQRTGIRGWLPAYAKEVSQLISTELFLRKMLLTRRIFIRRKSMA